MKAYRVVRIGPWGRRFSVSSFDETGAETWLDVAFDTEEQAREWIDRRQRWDRGEIEITRTSGQPASSD